MCGFGSAAIAMPYELRGCPWACSAETELAGAISVDSTGARPRFKTCPGTSLEAVATTDRPIYRASAAHGT